MLYSEIDHIAITAPSLEVGAKYVQRTLGISMQAGGEHPRMGTHNRLLGLGDSCYLEVIAINPNAASPQRPRWFELDSPNPAIHLATWIVRTNDISAAAAASDMPLGEIETMSRGALNWRITIPADGSLPFNGITPALIQWSDGVHPASALTDVGCRLFRLKGFHPEAVKIEKMLDAIGFDGPLKLSPIAGGEKPYLVAEIQTPQGLRQLRSPMFP